MNLITKFAALAMAAMAVVGFSSCLNTGKAEYTTTQAFPNCLNIITSSTSTDVQTGISYAITYNLAEVSSADVTLVNFKDVNGQLYGELTFEDVVWKQDTQGWKEIALSNATPVLNSGANGPTFSSFHISILDRVVNNTIYNPLVSIKYIIDGYTYVSTPLSILCTGTTTCNGTNGSYTPEGQYLPLYYFEVDATANTVTMTIDNALFDASMPGGVIKVKDIPVSYNADGSFTILKDEEMDVYYGATATGTTLDSNSKISKLSGRFDSMNNFSLNFTYSTSSHLSEPFTTVVTAYGSTPTSAQ